MKTTAQKRKEAREARAADPYAYQRSQEQKVRKESKKLTDEARKKGIKIFNAGVDGAIARMELYLATHPQQMDHDRDIVLLDIHRMLRELTGTRLSGG